MPHRPTDLPQRTTETEQSGGWSREDWRRTTEPCNLWVEPNVPWGFWQPPEVKRKAGEHSVDIGYIPGPPNFASQEVLLQESSPSMPWHGGSKDTVRGQMDQFEPELAPPSGGVVEGGDGALREHVEPENFGYAAQDPSRSAGPASSLSGRAWDMPRPRGWPVGGSATALYHDTGGYTSQLQRQPVPFEYGAAEGYPSSAAGQAPYSEALVVDQGLSSSLSNPFIGSVGGHESPFSSFGNTPTMSRPSWLNHSIGFDQVPVPASGEFEPTMAWDQDEFSSYPSFSSTPLFPPASWDVGMPPYPDPQVVVSTSASAMEGGLGKRGSGYRKLQESTFLAQAQTWQPSPIQTYTVNELAHFPEVKIALPTPPETPTHRSNRSSATAVSLAPRWPSYIEFRRIAPMPSAEVGDVGTGSKKRSHTEALGTEAERVPTRPAEPTFPCPILHCDKMFARIDQAKRHAETARQQMDGVFNFPCAVTGCTKKFRLKHKRKEHVAKVHDTN